MDLPEPYDSLFYTLTIVLMLGACVTWSVAFLCAATIKQTMRLNTASGVQLLLAAGTAILAGHTNWGVFCFILAVTTVPTHRQLRDRDAQLRAAERQAAAETDDRLGLLWPDEPVVDRKHTDSK